MYDGVLTVHSDEAIVMAKRMAYEEGILCGSSLNNNDITFFKGISAGANVCAANRVASRPEFKDKLVVTVLPSFGERYLYVSLPLEISNHSDPLFFIMTSVIKPSKCRSKV